MDPVITNTLRISLALLFGSAAYHKARDFGVFSTALEQYRLLPKRSIPGVASSLIGLECMLAGLFLVPLAVRATAFVGGLVLAIYSGAIAINLARGRREIDCGCGGPAAGRTLGAGLLVRNALLIVGCALSAMDTLPRTLLWIDWVTVSFAVTTLALSWMAAGALGAVSKASTRSREQRISA
jgi:hypothetical protein